jgi:anti-anti-sigma factor
VINFSISSELGLDVAVVTPKGYLSDVGGRQLEQAVGQFLDKGFKKLIINFSDVEFINTVGVSVFNDMLQKATKHGCRVCFTNMNKLHREVFALTGVTKYVPLFQDEADAVQYLQATL